MHNDSSSQEFFESSYPPDDRDIEEIKRELRAEGIDPDEIVHRVHQLVQAELGESSCAPVRALIRLRNIVGGGLLRIWPPLLMKKIERLGFVLFTVGMFGIIIISWMGDIRLALLASLLANIGSTMEYGCDLWVRRRAWRESIRSGDLMPSGNMTLVIGIGTLVTSISLVFVLMLLQVIVGRAIVNTPSQLGTLNAFLATARYLPLLCFVTLLSWRVPWAWLKDYSRSVENAAHQRSGEGYSASACQERMKNSYETRE